MVGHATGEFFHLAEDLFAQRLAVFAPAGVAQGDVELVEVVEEFLWAAALWHAVFDAVPPDAGGGFEQGAAAVAELHPVDGEVDVGAVAGAVVPGGGEVGGDLEAEEVDGLFAQLVVAVGGGGGFLEQRREGPVEDLGRDPFFGAVDGAFAGRLDLVEIFQEAEPLLERAVGERDFEGAHGGAPLVGAQDADAQCAAGVADKCGEPSVEGGVVPGLAAALGDGGVEDHVVEPAALQDLVDGLEARCGMRGSWPLGRTGILGTGRSGRVWQFCFGKMAYCGCRKLTIGTVFASKGANSPPLIFLAEPLPLCWSNRSWLGQALSYSRIDRPKVDFTKAWGSTPTGVGQCQKWLNL